MTDGDVTNRDRAMIIAFWVLLTESGRKALNGCKVADDVTHSSRNV